MTNQDFLTNVFVALNTQLSMHSEKVYNYITNKLRRGETITEDEIDEIFCELDKDTTTSCLFAHQLIEDSLIDDEDVDD